MKILKTIVATAAIVLALTTVATAGVRHVAGQGGKATGSRAQAAQPTFAVTLPAAQLAHLMVRGGASTTGGPLHARHAQAHARHAQYAKSVRHQARSHEAESTTRAASSVSGGTHHREATHHGATHHAGSSTSGPGSRHARTSHHSSHHSGDHGEGGSCVD
jgi:hypothetical protein